MKKLAKLFIAAVLVTGLNHAFATDGRKEAVLDMGKGAFTLTVSVPAETDGPYDFGKNPGIGKEMTGQFQHQEVMFNANLEQSTAVVVYKATAQKIDPNKKGQKLTAEHMAQDQIKANGFENKAVKFECPAAPVVGAKSVCYKMSGDAVFEGKALPHKYAAVLVSISWANDTRGYTLMGKVIENNTEKFLADPTSTEKSASRALGRIWTSHKVDMN